MQEHLPAEVVSRPDKKGFPTPFGPWLKGPLQEYASDVFARRAFRQRGLFRPHKVAALFERHKSGQADHAWLLWRILNIETWLGIFQDDFEGTCGRYSPEIATALPL